jgi:hypothetical protein
MKMRAGQERTEAMNAVEALKTIRDYADTQRGDVLGAVEALQNLQGKVRLLLAWDEKADADETPDHTLWELLDELRDMMGLESKDRWA